MKKIYKSPVLKVAYLDSQDALLNLSGLDDNPDYDNGNGTTDVDNDKTDLTDKGPGNGSNANFVRGWFGDEW